MDAADVTLAMRVGWLVLCGMMLFSRFVFQAAGAVWMRSFLDTWKTSRTHRLWGWAAFLAGLLLGAGVTRTWGELRTLDRALSLLLVLVLCADGLLNLFPAAFGHFKERMQTAWVRRQPAERAGDRHLFGTVNALLGLAAAGVAALVFLYEPMPVAWLLGAAALAAGLMTVLIVGCRREMPAPREAAR
jgi:hypothetical protein